MKTKVILALLLLLALAACAGRDEAITAQEAQTDPVLLEIVADHEYVLLLARVEDVAQVGGDSADWLVVSGLADGDRVEVQRGGGDVFEVFPLE